MSASGCAFCGRPKAPNASCDRCVILSLVKEWDGVSGTASVLAPRLAGFYLLLARSALEVGAAAFLVLGFYLFAAWVPLAGGGVLPPAGVGASLVLAVALLSFRLPVELSIRRRLAAGPRTGIPARPDYLPHLLVDGLDRSRAAGTPKGGVLVLWEGEPYVAVDSRYCRAPALLDMYVRKETIRFRLLDRPFALHLLRAVEGGLLEFPVLTLLGTRRHRPQGRAAGGPRPVPPPAGDSTPGGAS